MTTTNAVRKSSGALRRKIARRRWRLYVMLLIPVAYIIIFKYIPMYGIIIAFKNYTVRKGIWDSDWVGLQQFQKFFTSYYFGRVIRNTLTLSLYSLLVGFPLPIILALLMNASPFPRFRSAVENITYMPHFISVVVMVGMIMNFFNTRSGVYGSLYSLLTGGKTAPDLLASPSAFSHLYVWTGIWQGLGWGTIIYIAALAAVDATLHEAATVDGATRLQRVIHIDIPCILPTIMIRLILASGAIMAIGFDKVYLMQNNLNIDASEVISTYTYKAAFGTSNSNYSYSTAIGLFNSLVNGGMLVLVNLLAGKLSETSLW